MSQRIALYARVSSERQAEEGTVESQVSSLREYATEQNYKINEKMIFIDNGISGGTLERPALDKLRDLSAAGEIDRLIILCPDRLARKHTHQLILSEELKRLGVELEFVNRKLSESPEDQLLFQIQGVISEFEREKIMERSRRGKLFKAKQGQVSVMSAAPYGYVYIPKAEKEPARYEMHEEESKIVQSIFRMCAHEGLTLGAIARRLSEKEILTRKKETQWNRSSVHKILANPAYSGFAAYRKTKSVPRTKMIKSTIDNGGYSKTSNSSRRLLSKEEWLYIPVPRIISETIFAKVQTQLQDNKKFSTRNNTKNQYLLSGLLRCDKCGYVYFGITTHSKNKKSIRSYYTCSGTRLTSSSNNQKICSGQYIRTAVLDDIVWEQTKQLIENPKVILEQYATRRDKKPNQQLAIEDLLGKKQKEIRRHNGEKERLLDLYQSGKVEHQEISKRLDRIRAAVLKTEEEYSYLENQARQEHKQLQLIEQIGDFQKKFTGSIDNLTFEQKKKILRLLISKILVNCDTAEITVEHIVPLSKTYQLCTERVV